GGSGGGPGRPAPGWAMSSTPAVLRVGAASLLAVALFVLSHRRDAFGMILAAILGFDAVACALVGFAGLAPTAAEAAQLQSFSLLVEIVGALFAGSGIGLAALLRRRTGGSDLLEMELAWARPGPGARVELEPEPESAPAEGPDADEPGADEPGPEAAEPEAVEMDPAEPEAAPGTSEEA
ncbi:MAG TPA: hypothetical protein VI138_01615, partial [Candidatus Dormibacteraeota bacterium]